MDGTPLPQNLYQGIHHIRFLQSTFGDGALQSGEMAAVQGADEIGRAQLEGVTLFQQNFPARPQLCLCGRKCSLASQRHPLELGSILAQLRAKNRSPSSSDGKW